MIQDMLTLDWNAWHEPENIGGLLSKIVLAQHLSKGDSPVMLTLHVSSKVWQQKIEEVLADIKQPFSLRFCNNSERCTVMGPSVYEAAEYSLETINELVWESAGRRPEIVWKPESIAREAQFVRGLRAPTLAVHLRRGEQPDLASLDEGVIDELIEASEHLVSTQLRVLFLSSVTQQVQSMDIIGRWPVVDLSTLPLSRRLILSTSADFFLASASGFCSAAIFSKKPFLIYKHPEHHASSAEREIGPNGIPPFLSENQLFVRGYPNSGLLVGLLS